MAIAIKSTPVLTGKTAKEFVKRAEENAKKQGTIDFTEHKGKAERILKNAKF